MVDKPYWEQVAETRWGRYISSIEWKAILQAHQYHAKPGRMLEVGSGGGRWSKRLSELGWDVSCTDIDEKSLEYCRVQVPVAHCILVQSGVEVLPFGDRTLELVLNIEVFPVIGQAWFAREAARVLVPGGFLVGVFNNRDSWRGKVQHWRARTQGKFDYYCDDYAHWRADMRRRGFEFVSETGLCWFPLPRTSNSRFTSVFAQLELLTGLRRLVRISPWVVFVARYVPK